jgi:hypothetical protein
VTKPLAVVPDLEAELDDLYGLQPAEFTSARNDLAQRLKRAGQAEPAARVQAIRKPTVPIWAINQLARQAPKEIEALLSAGEELRSAQETALGGGDPKGLRDATSAERNALRALTQRAQALLADAGHSPSAAVIERIASTLRSAAVDPDGRELLAAGRLGEELESAGFGAFTGMKVSPRPRKPRQAAGKRTGAAEERRRKERLRKLRERARKLAASAAEARRAAERAESEAARERRNADRAAAAAEQARAELEAAEEGDPE